MSAPLAGRACVVLLSLIVALTTACRAGGPAREPAGAPLVEVGDGRLLMGTVLDITLVGRDEAALRRHLDWAFARVAELEAIASRHREDSELTRLNASAGGPPASDHSPELRELLRHSVDAARLTGGAFDVTVGPLIDLWWQAAERDRWPADAELEAALARTGVDGLVIGDDGAIGLARPGLAVDFGGIGKGYALDVVRAGLVSRSVEHALLDFGGSSVWAMGRDAAGRPWRLEVDTRAPGAPPLSLELVDRALSVSSSLGESSTIEGRVVGHVIDPRTGLTVDTARTSVAVGNSATRAEIWTTALLVLDADDGLARASSDASTETWVLFESGEVVATPGFARIAR